MVEILSTNFYTWELAYSYGNSVLVSVTTRYQSEPRWDRNFWFSPHDSLESLVLCEQNFMPLGERGPLEWGGEKEAPPLKSIIPPLLALLMWKWLQIGTDMPLIITSTGSTGNELLRNVNIDNLEWPQTPKIGDFSEFFAILGCNMHFKVNCTKMAGDRPREPPYEIFSIECRF